MKRLGLLLGCVLLGGSLLLLYRFWHGPPAEPVPQETLKTRFESREPHAASGALVAQPVAAVTLPMPTPAGANPTAERPADAPPAPPVASEVAAEAARDPHTTPTSLLSFAASLAPHMAAALQSEPAARRLFVDLETCAAHSANVARSARALCLSDAALLVEKHPSLRRAYTSLLARTDPQIVDLAR